MHLTPSEVDLLLAVVVLTGEVPEYDHVRHASVRAVDLVDTCEIDDDECLFPEWPLAEHALRVGARATLVYFLFHRVHVLGHVQAAKMDPAVTNVVGYACW
jgi:hypothetical protein